MLKIRQLLINISIFVLALVLILFFLEWYLRLFSPQLTLERAEKISIKVFDKSDYTPWKLKPNSSDTMISPYNEFKVQIRINSYGLRDNEFGVKKDKYAHRILFLGDSFTWGYGVKLEDTYIKKLEVLLNKNKKGKIYENINLGRADGGNAPDVQYLYLKNKGINFSPDTVIIGFFVENDISDISDKNIWSRIDTKGLPLNITSNFYYVDEQNRLRHTSQNKEYYKKYSVFSNINYLLSKKSQLFILIKNFLIGKKEPPTKVFFKELPDNLIENFSKIKILLKEMKKISSENNSSFIIVLIPSKIQVEDKFWEKYKKYYKNFETSRTMPNDLIMEFCKESNITCIDLLPEFLKEANKGGYYFNIDGHWNEKGHELAAERIYSYITKENVI